MELVVPPSASTAPTQARQSDRVRSRARAAPSHSLPPCATGRAPSTTLRPASGVLPAIADAALPPARSPPYLSVLWRPVEQSRMPGAVLHQRAHSETCRADAPFPTKKSVPLGFLIRCTP